jgi:predicted dehydrogenase
VLRLARGSYRPKKPEGNWFLDEEKSGGILMDFMIHDYDYARWIAGEVESVFAQKIAADQTASVDYGLVILRHTGGALSHIAGSWAYPPPTAFRTGFEIAGMELDRILFGGYCSD